jgi:hypothetical protein
VPDFDAAVVERLKGAGAVIVNALSTAATALRGSDGAEGVRFVAKRLRWGRGKGGHAMSVGYKSEGV